MGKQSFFPPTIEITGDLNKLCNQMQADPRRAHERLYYFLLMEMARNLDKCTVSDATHILGRVFDHMARLDKQPSMISAEKLPALTDDMMATVEDLMRQFNMTRQAAVNAVVQTAKVAGKTITPEILDALEGWKQ